MSKACVAVAITIFLGCQSAHAETWAPAYHVPHTAGRDTTEVSIDTDSLEQVGELTRYRYRIPGYGGGYRLSVAFADCERGLHGMYEWGMAPAYGQGKREIDVVCAQPGAKFARRARPEPPLARERSTGVHAVTWATAYHLAPAPYFDATDVSIDTDSIEQVGALIKYRYRFPAYHGGYSEGHTFAHCGLGLRGTGHGSMLPANGLDKTEVEAACAHAGVKSARRGSAEIAAVPTPPGPQTEPPKSAPTTSTRPVEQVASGSGFAVGARLVVTNHHVTDGCKELSVRRESTTYPATLKAASGRSDLALLATDQAMPGVPALRQSAALGEDVMVAGHPLSGLLGTNLIVTSGQVNSLAGLGNDPTVLQISAPVQPGNSGGPLIDRYGSIVGVVVSKLNVERLHKITGDMAQNINFAIKPEVLRMFLDSNRVPYKSPNVTKRLEGVELAERARGFTVQVLCSK